MIKNYLQDVQSETSRQIQANNNSTSFIIGCICGIGLGSIFVGGICGIGGYFLGVNQTEKELHPQVEELQKDYYSLEEEMNNYRN